MTDPPAEDRDVDGDFLTVEQVAQLRQVTPAAIRAQLRGGNLAGQQVLRGQRTVWRIPVSAVRPSLDEPAGATPTPTPTPTPDPAERPARPPETVRPVPQPPPSLSEPGRSSSGRVDVLEAEVRRLRRQLSALAEAHRRLLDAVTAGFDEDLPS